MGGASTGSPARVALFLRLTPQNIAFEGFLKAAGVGIYNIEALRFGECA